MEQELKKTITAAAPKSFSVPLWVLVFIESFTIWQMGVVYYSSKVFTINGITPLPVSVDTAALPIALGYLAGTTLAWGAPRRVGLWGRGLAIISLTCILAMFASLPDSLLVLLYYFTVFTCVTFISVGAVLAINVYSLKTALTDGVAAALLSSPFIAALHYHPLALDFRIFNAISALIQLLILIGLSQIPVKTDTVFMPKPPRSKTGEKRKAPVFLISGTLLVFTIVCLCALFSSTAAESVRDGISLYYLTGTGWAALYAWLHFKRRISPFKLYTIFLGITAVGFILWLLPFDLIKPVSLVMQSAAIILCNLAWFMARVLFEKWNRRWVAPVCILIALITVLLHSGLLEALRSQTAALYAIYAGITLVLLVIYFVTEPYLQRVWIDAYKNDNPQSQTFQPAAGKAADLLTRREKEVLPLLISGYDNASIARMLYISDNTVKFHIKNIFQKYDVHTRFELTAKINRLEIK